MIATDELEPLVDLLGRERALLDVLLHRLATLRALLVIGDDRFLARAATEVERASAAVHTAELHRAVLVSELADAHGVPQELITLSSLIEGAGPPWRALLADHRAGLLALTAEVDDQASAVRRLARAASLSMAEILTGAGAP